jgi:cytochrome c553
MAHLLAHLTDDYLGELGDYFAGLDVPYAAPRPATLSAATRERGRALIESGDATRDIPACVRCHGDALLGVAPGVPGLLGLPRDYLNAQLGAWQTGLRHARAPDCMAKIASRLAPSDIEAVSAWLASQPVPTGGKPATSFTQRPPLTCGSIPGADRR